MTHPTASPLPDLSDLHWSEWCDAVYDAVIDDGFAEKLGSDHFALFREQKPVLLVTFENYPSVHRTPYPGAPLTTPLVEALGWSHLALISEGDSWFRANEVIGFFDRLIDDGFFEDFDQVIFYGAGPAGYAACAFSVAAPGAKVLALQPQATLERGLTEWDNRFTHTRRLDFSSRFGYAPFMVEAASQAWVVYNPLRRLDAMHASLFSSSNVTRLRVRHFDADLQEGLLRIKALFRLLALLSSNRLTRTTAARLFKQRHNDRGYLLNLMYATEARGGHALLRRLCTKVLSFDNSRPFRKGLRRANRAAEAEQASLAAADTLEGGDLHPAD